MKEKLSILNSLFVKTKSILSIKITLILLGFWGILFAIYRFIFFPLNFDVPQWFPSSVIIGIWIHPQGIPYFFVFLALPICILLFYKKINEFVLLIGCGLIILFGNLMQGGFEFAFLQPFYAGKSQYYHDALEVPNVQNWLASFNANQAQLTLHSRTHPPFAVLIHDLFFVLFPRGGIYTLSIGFSLLSLSTVLFVLLILRIYNIESNKRKLLITLFSVLPAINIYTIVCLDGVISASSTLFLLGILILVNKPKIKIFGYAFMALGLVITNLLTYGGVFLIGIAACFIAIEYYQKRGTLLLKGFIFSFLCFLAVIYILFSVYHYNHIQGFITASSIENPNGFRLFSDPINYVLTRFENVSEILFFLSFGVLSIFFSDKLFSLQKKPINLQNNQLVVLIGSLLLLLMFLSGAFRTGETARTCLFIYPYLFFALFNLQDNKIMSLIIMAGIQTAIMQLFVNFFW